MHLVLNLLEEDAGSWCIRIVVDGSGVNVSNLLVEATFAESDFPDFFQEMLKVVDVQESAVLHPLFVDNVASYGELPEDIGTPLAELGGSQGVDAITN